MDFLKFHPGLPCPTLLGPAGEPSQKRPTSTFLDTPRRTPMLPLAGYGLSIRNSFLHISDGESAEWIVIRGPLRGHNDMSFGGQTSSRPMGRPGVGHPQGVFGVFS
jgi:hypothetical protein